MENLISIFWALALFGAYLLGRKHESGTKIKNPIETIKKQVENKKAKKEISELDTRLDAMLNYDGPPKQFDESGRRINESER